MKRARGRGDNYFQCDPNLIGYARVSTDEQNLDAQIDALIRAGVCSENIFSEKLSGVATRRPERDAAIKQCRPGSTLVVTKLDRVGRSLYDLLTLIRSLDADGIGFKSLGDTIDTTTPIGKVVLAVLGAFAEFERDLIRQRTVAGVRAAQERGMKFGPPTKMTADVRQRVEAAIMAGATVKEAAKAVKLAESTIRLHYKSDRLEELRARKPRKK